MHLFTPRTAYRGAGGRGGGRGASAGGVGVDYWLANEPAQPVVLEFEDASGNAIKSFNSTPRTEAAPTGGRPGRGGGESAAPTARAGMNRFSWDMRYPDAHGIEGGTFFLGGSLRGPLAIPGQYKVKITVGDQTATQSFEIKKDPRVSTTTEDYRKQFELALALRDKLSADHDAVNQIHNIQKQIADAMQKASSDASAADAAHKLNDDLSAIVRKLYEPRFTGFDDQTLVYSLKLNSRIASLAGNTQNDFGPTDQQEQVFAVLSTELGQLLDSLKQTLDTQLPALNAKLKTLGAPPVTATAPASSSNPD
jgi:hypothetical protein